MGAGTGAATPVAHEDLVWLQMDRPNNLMHVHALLGFDELPDLDEVRVLIRERMVRRHPVLSQVPVELDGTWCWQGDPDFRLDRHVRVVALHDPSEEAVRGHVADQLSVPLDRSHPLWEVQVLTGPPEQGPGGWVLARFHHGLGDGIRLVQLLLGTCDPVDGAVPQAVGRNVEVVVRGPVARARHAVQRAAVDVADDVAGAAGVALRTARSLVARRGSHGLGRRVARLVGLARHPAELLDALEHVGSVDNELSNSVGELGRMLLTDGHDAHAWDGHAGVRKAAAWVEGVPLDGVRTVARAHEATVNDVLVAAVSLAMTAYLEGRGVTDVDELSWLLPVSVQPVDPGLPAELGNHFVLVMLSMPLGVTDPHVLLDEVHERTTRLKHSAEPVVSAVVQQAIARSPAGVARRVTDFFAGRTVGQLSNVPGPRVAVSMAGATVRTILGWAPTSGDQPLGICLVTYADTVNVGVGSDHRMIPDPERLAELVARELTGLAEIAGGARA